MLRLATTIVLLAVAYVGVTAAQVWRAASRDDAQPAQAIIVLGAAQYDGRPSPVLRARLDHAADLYEQGHAPVVWVTGGGRPGDRTTEGQSGYTYLRSRGLPEDALQVENQGRSSWESLAATARFLHRRGTTSVLLVSHPYHSYRIAAIAEELGLHAHVSPTQARRLDPLDTARAVARETAAVSVGRIVGYRRLTGINPRARTGERAPSVATLAP